MRDSEDREMLANIGGKVNELIDKELDKYSIDRAYFHFKLSVELFGSSMIEKMGEIVLMDDHDSYCQFCGTRTYFYDSRLGMALCAKCYKDINDKGN